jgi:hypothetical protein
VVSRTFISIFPWQKLSNDDLLKILKLKLTPLAANHGNQLIQLIATPLERSN